MPKTRNDLAERALRDKARAYVRSNMHAIGGSRQAWQGFWRKTFPFVFGFESRPSALRILAMLIQGGLLLCAAMAPILIRRVAEFRTPSPDPEAVFFTAITHVDALDIFLALLVVLLNVSLKFFEPLTKRRPPPGRAHLPFHDLCAAIDKMPAFATVQQERRANPPTDEAIRLALQGLKIELTHLIGDDQNKQLVDITLLEYCDVRGQQMQVRVRTASHEPTRRPMRSWQVMADYVAKEGRWFVEHDFLNPRNPFPPVRLSLPGKHRIEYRSVLFLPIIFSTTVTATAELDGTRRVQSSVDQCMGVICAHSPRPYRFWRWGDHKKEMGGFGNVAYQRSLPYITLVRRLLEQSANKVALEVS